MPELRPGDIFTTANPMMLGRAICAAEAFWSADGVADYSHAGIILGPQATTFEALWTNKRQGLFPAYRGRKVLIGRHEDMNGDRFLNGWAAVEHLEGKAYAGHRLFLHLIPPLARLISTGGFAVCSELAAKFLVGAGLLNFWAGVNPDWIADMIQTHKGWSVVFEGELPATLQSFRGSGPVEPIKTLEEETCLLSVGSDEKEGLQRTIQRMMLPPKKSDGVRRRKRGSAVRLPVFSAEESPTPVTWGS